MPPQNLAAEQAVLGAVLRYPDLADRVLAELRPVDCASRPHQVILAAMAGLWQAGKSIDPVTLADALAACGGLEAAGGPAYLGELLIERAPLAPSATPHHLAIVREMAKRRAMLAMARRMMEIAYDPEHEPGEFVEIATRASEAVLSDRIEIRGETPAEFLSPYMAYLERLENDCGGVDTPFWRCNDYIRAMMPGELVVIGARPGNGKTALALTMAEHAINQGKKVGIFSLEMMKDQLLNRIFSSATGVSAQRFRDGKFTDADWSRLYAHAEKMQHWPIYIYDGNARRVSDIRSACRRWRRNGGLDIAFVDYLQLAEADGRFASREQEVGSISSGLKNLTKELGIPVVVLAQLGREVEKRPSKRAINADLRESGKIEQDADIIFLIQPWDAAVKGDVMFTKLTVGKSRNSASGDLPVAYNRKLVRFESDDRV